MTVIMDGKSLANKIKENVKKEIITLDNSPKLIVISINSDEASKIYVKNKEKSCLSCGIKFENIILDNPTHEEVKEIIEKLNNDQEVNGILIQSPIPDYLNYNALVNLIDPIKDVDGFTNLNISKAYLNEECIVSCTAKGIMTLFKEYNIELNGKNVVIINRSNIVGKPLFFELLKNNATISMLHSKTKDISLYTKFADIIIVAVGIPNFIKKDMIKENSILIDVGINRIENKIVGDVDYESCYSLCSYITPVPKGVGPLTVASLMENTLIAYKNQNEK